MPKMLDDPSAPIPIYLSLVDLARSNKTIPSYLSDLVEKMGVEKSYADNLWQEIKRGHAFVALDSLDEVDPRQRPDIIDQINNRASEKGNTWLVGSRFSEYKGGQFKRGQFCEWELLAMTPELRRGLAERLLPELSRLFNRPLSDQLAFKDAILSDAEASSAANTCVAFRDPIANVASSKPPSEAKAAEKDVLSERKLVSVAKKRFYTP